MMIMIMMMMMTMAMIIIMTMMNFLSGTLKWWSPKQYKTM